MFAWSAKFLLIIQLLILGGWNVAPAWSAERQVMVALVIDAESRIHDKKQPQTGEWLIDMLAQRAVQPHQYPKYFSITPIPNIQRLSHLERVSKGEIKSIIQGDAGQGA